MLTLVLSLLFKCLLVALTMLAHELGHVLAARWYRIPVRKIGFNRMGIYIQRARGTGWPEVATCLAGAAMNLVLALLFWNARGPGWSYWFALCNLIYAIVNLLPIRHSDGTHALEALRAMPEKERE